MGDACSSATQGILAHSNVDLISNGYINANDTDRRGKPIQMLPASRMSIEFQYSIRSGVTGTSINSLSPGGNAAFVGGVGALGGGAGAALASAIGCSLLGDMEPTRSQFIFHVCKSETKINQSIVVTQTMINEALNNHGVITYEFPSEYPIAVLGVTKKPIKFSQDEIDNIGAGSGNSIGHLITSDGLIQARFENFDSSSSDNLFIKIVRDPRKLQYRADNNIPGDTEAGFNAFINASADDLTDRKISIQLMSQSDIDKKVLPKVGDPLFVTFDSATDRVVRQAIFVSSYFFLFPAFEVERIGTDQVKAWNFYPFLYKVNKSASKKATTHDWINDQNNPANSSLETIEGQRLVEVINDTKNMRPYIRGFYFADSRGILSYDLKDTTGQPYLEIPASSIRDQVWWKKFMDSYMDGGPGFDKNGVLDVKSEGAARKLRGFIFDVSGVVNSVCYDNDKFGYQRELATALGSVSKYNASDPKTGIGTPNLDIYRLNLVASNDGTFDLSNARFVTYSMSSVEGGAYFVRDCNKTFTYDQAFCTFGTLQADMFIRTPFFFDKFPLKSRVYVERFTPQFALSRDGGIWVSTRPSAGEDISVDASPKRDTAVLVFNRDNAINYHLLNDATLRSQISKTRPKVESVLLNHDAPSIDSLTQANVTALGYDQIYGNQPSYSRGLPITVDGGMILRNFASRDMYKTTKLTFVQKKDSSTLTAVGMSGKRIKTLSISYLPNKDAKVSGLLTFVFPKNKLVIDNMAISNITTDRGSGVQTASFNMAYYTDDSIRIDGQLFLNTTIKDIEITYLAEEQYGSFSVASSNASVTIDGRGTIYVFYEDTQNNPSSPPAETGWTGFNTSDHTEISCLVSEDNGVTWFDHKAVVRTMADELVRNPVATCEKNSNLIHLMYVHNDCLVHKEIPSHLFDINDAFINYSRPLLYNENMPRYYGLSRYSTLGQILRTSPASVVVGDMTKGGFLDTQDIIYKNMKGNTKLSRFSIYGNRSNYKTKFIETSYISVMDKKGALRIMYASNGKVYIRSGDGFFWNSPAPDGLAFHKNVLTQDAKPVSSVGFAFDEFANILNLTYIVDGMMFLKRFELSSFEINNDSMTDIANPDKYDPLFVVGEMTDEVFKAIQSKKTNIRYMYPQVSLGVFNQKMSISDVSTKGFIGASGDVRCFYLDGDGDIRAFSLLSSNEAPLLDSKLKVS